MIPNEHSYCELDPKVVDEWGIPVLRFHWKWSDHETRQAAHMHKTFADLITAMGGKPTSTIETDGAKAIAAGGEIIHEVGTVRMGNDARTSVLDRWSPGARGEEPVRRRRGGVRVQRRQEPDPEHPGAGLAGGAIT